MALVLGDNFSYGGAKPLDARLKYSTVAEMKAVSDSTMYDGCLAYCSETEKTYQWKSTNSVDETLGRWREFETGGGSGGTTDYEDLDNKPSINNIELSGKKTSSDLGLASKENMDKAYKSDDTVTTTITDDDYFPLLNSPTHKRTLWSNIKAKLKEYFDTIYDLNKYDIPFYATSSTGASTTAKTATVSRGTFGLVAGAKVSVRFTNTNTASAPTLNVGSTGAKNIKYIASDGTVTTPTTWWGAGEVVTFVYNGTQWLMMPTISMIPSLPVVGTIDRSTIYDTTEKVIGKWTDGRPIYQKTFSGTLTGTTTVGTEVTTEVAMGVNVNAYIDVEGWAYNSTNKVYQKFNLCAPSNSNGTLRIVCNANGHASKPNKILLVNSWTLTSDTTLYYLTVRYTKSTDAANSYNYANENDYSTSEKIVGTWIDGKQLYQKTYTLSFSVTSTSTWQSFNVASISGIWIKEFSGYIDRNDDLIVPLCCDVDDGAKYSVRTNSSNNTIKFTAYTTGSTTNASGTLYLTIKYTKS